MIKITLLRESAIRDGSYFSQIIEAVNRGCKLTWNHDFTKAVLVLDTDSFFTKEDAISIVSNGGEVEGYTLKLKMPIEHFNTAIVPLAFEEYNENGEAVTVEKTYAQAFPIFENIPNEVDGQPTEPVECIVYMSIGNELLKASTVINITTNDASVILY